MDREEQHEELKNRVMDIFGVDIDQEDFEGDYPIRPKRH
jgi:hypothetical protein